MRAFMAIVTRLHPGTTELFERFCVPSVAEQTLRGFVWYVVVPDDWGGPVPEDATVIVGGGDIREAVARVGVTWDAGESDAVVTVMLEPGCAMCRTFMETVSRVVHRKGGRGRQPFAVSWATGLDYDAETGECHSRVEVMSPVRAYCEDLVAIEDFAPRLTTVFGAEWSARHRRAVRVHQVQEGYGWLDGRGLDAEKGVKVALDVDVAFGVGRQKTS